VEWYGGFFPWEDVGVGGGGVVLPGGGGDYFDDVYRVRTGLGALIDGGGGGEEVLDVVRKAFADEAAALL